MDLLQRITIDPAVRFGKPCVRGTRLTVGDVLGTLASGCSEADLLADFPQLCHEDVLACLAFAAERERRLMARGLKDQEIAAVLGSRWRCWCGGLAESI